MPLKLKLDIYSEAVLEVGETNAGMTCSFRLCWHAVCQHITVVYPREENVVNLLKIK
jgi:hypothetical protein